tara:strand:+ start:2479 stop:2679 length:201 start_codon:yes stop_codon:yes gene_type:complete
MIYVGIILILVLNAFLYYDSIQHNKDLFEDKKLALNMTVCMFIIVELLIFLSFYVLAIKATGVFYD